VNPPSASRASVPPSERGTSRHSFDAIDAGMVGTAFAARFQMMAALLLGLVLVAIPLYLWRRPRTESISATIGMTDAGALPAVTAGATAPVNEGALQLGDPKVVGCQDPGPKKTPPEKCDHVVEVEQQFAKAIADSASCVPKEAGGGSIIYVADVAFRKKQVVLNTPREGRTMKNAKAVTACDKAIRAKLSPLPWDAKHEHARYFISITATYPGAVK
jgi:hypothetical protein